MYCLGPFTLVRPATIIDNTQALNRYDKLVNKQQNRNHLGWYTSYTKIER